MNILSHTHTSPHPLLLFSSLHSTTSVFIPPLSLSLSRNKKKLAVKIG